AAILAQQHPDWTPERLKTTLMSTSLGLEIAGFRMSTYAQGAGRVDIARAVSQRLWTDTANISPGILEFGDPAYVVPVTYHNDSTSDLTLSLSATLETATGPAPAGMLSLDQDTLTVPAGGSATLTITLDSNAPTDDYQGVLTATSGAGDSLRTPIGVTVLPPRSELTIRLVKPAPADELPYFEPGVWSAVRVDDREVPWYEQAISWRDTEDPNVVEATTPLPDGVYTLTSSVNWAQSTGPQMRHIAWVIEPEVQVDGDTEITIDLRELVPITVSTDKPSEKVWWVNSHARTTESGLTLTSWQLNGMPEAYQGWRYPTDPVTHGELSIRDGFI